MLRRYAGSSAPCEVSINKPTLDILRDIMSDALVKSFGAEYSNTDPMMQSSRPDFGDYQCNVALSLAKKLKLKPRDISNRMVASLSVGPNSVIKSVNVSGPGFININLSDNFLKSKALSMLSDRAGKLAIPAVEHPERIVVDYSSPNIAKEMHVVSVHCVRVIGYHERCIGSSPFHYSG